MNQQRAIIARRDCAAVGAVRDPPFVPTNTCDFALQRVLEDERGRLDDRPDAQHQSHDARY